MSDGPSATIRIVANAIPKWASLATGDMYTCFYAPVGLNGDWCKDDGECIEEGKYTFDRHCFEKPEHAVARMYELIADGALGACVVCVNVSDMERDKR